MRYERNNVDTKKRPINLTIRADLIEQAKELDLNTSQAAEIGIAAAIKSAREKAWLEENKEWIAAHNERVAREGVLLPVQWMKI
jgi:antitoxin CcdA